MDFGELLHIAKKNSEASKNGGNYYSTKYAPPKKVSKDKKLSENIQKFLKKREQEEQERKREERQKLANLIAQRDEKAKNKIRKMLKATKSANKSVLDDATDAINSAITAGGPESVDQDDYGYVSTEANAFYQKYIEKVKDVKEDKGFAPSRPQSVRDLSGTKERVKAAITREREEAKLHTRQRSSTTVATASTSSGGTSAASSSGNVAANANVSRAYSTSKTLYDPQAEKRDEERRKREEEQKKARNRKPPPPPMDFQALLKLAEKKQHEAVEFVLPEVKKKKEPERLLSAREKRELEERQRMKQERARREQQRLREPFRMDKNSKDRRDSGATTANSGSNAAATRQPMDTNGRLPKVNGSSTSKSATSQAKPSSSSSSSSSSATNGLKAKSTSNAFSHSNSSSSVKSSTMSTSGSKGNSSISSGTSLHKSAATTATTTTARSAASSSVTKSVASSGNSSSTVTSKNPYGASKSATQYSGPTRAFPPRDPAETNKTRQFPPADVQRSRQFPPPDVRRNGGGGSAMRRPLPQAQKRRIYDDDDEYDSELDDFIDDGDCEEDVSSHIRAIFGYDKRKYRDLDDDDANMVSSFAQVQREEYLSKKIGIQEDLEDMRLEAMQKKRKIQQKRKRRLDDDDDAC